MAICCLDRRARLSPESLCGVGREAAASELSAHQAGDSRVWHPSVAAVVAVLIKAYAAYQMPHWVLTQDQLSPGLEGVC